MKTNYDVAIIGLGYIGLPLALLAAKHGHSVLGYDINQERIDNINKGILDFSYHELANLIKNPSVQNNFHAASKLISARFIVITVPTPILQSKAPDLSYVWKATDEIIKIISAGTTIILESTVSVGATDQLSKMIQLKTGLKEEEDFFVVHCPERLLPGDIINELINNDRVIGAASEQGIKNAYDFYSAFVKGALHTTNRKTAEMVKLVENSSRDVQIAFAHEVAALSSAAGVDAQEVIQLANKHPRVNIFQPSCGVGGHCIPVDPWFLVSNFPEQARMLRTARLINDERPLVVAHSITEHVAMIRKTKPTQGFNILLLGATFKPNADDVRNSPALSIAKTLDAQLYDCTITIFDPHVTRTIFEQEKVLGTNVNYQKALENADLIIALVGHTYFKEQIDLLTGKNFLDFCGLIEKKALKSYSPSLIQTAHHSKQSRT